MFPSRATVSAAVIASLFDPERREFAACALLAQHAGTLGCPHRHLRCPIEISYGDHEPSAFAIVDRRRFDVVWPLARLRMSRKPRVVRNAVFAVDLVTTAFVARVVP